MLFRIFSHLASARQGSAAGGSAAWRWVRPPAPRRGADGRAAAAQAVGGPISQFEDTLEPYLLVAKRSADPPQPRLPVASPALPTRRGAGLLRRPPPRRGRCQGLQVPGRGAEERSHRENRGHLLRLLRPLRHQRGGCGPRGGRSWTALPADASALPPAAAACPASRALCPRSLCGGAVASPERRRGREGAGRSTGLRRGERRTARRGPRLADGDARPPQAGHCSLPRRTRGTSSTSATCAWTHCGTSSRSGAMRSFRSGDAPEAHLSKKAEGREWISKIVIRF